MRDLSLKIRLPSKMKAWLEMRSVQNVRSMNGEVVHLLNVAMFAEGASSTLPKEPTNNLTTFAEG